MSLFFEDQKVGAATALGAHTFTRESIIAFALLYDPQPFHLSEEAGKASIYGGLVASGWHTASVCMRLFIDGRDRARAERAALGETLPRLGLSPGFRDMRWLAPVRAGDTIAYAARVEFSAPDAAARLGRRARAQHRPQSARRGSVRVHQHGVLGAAAVSEGRR